MLYRRRRRHRCIYFPYTHCLSVFNALFIERFCIFIDFNFGFCNDMKKKKEIHNEERFLLRCRLLALLLFIIEYVNGIKCIIKKKKKKKKQENVFVPNSNLIQSEISYLRSFPRKMCTKVYSFHQSWRLLNVLKKFVIFTT